MIVGDRATFITPDGKKRVGKIVKVMKVNVKLEAGRGENKREFVVRKEFVNENPELGAMPARKPVKKVPKGSHRMPDGSIMKDSDMPKKPRGAKKNRASSSNYNK